MRCEEVRERLDDHVDGTLVASERAELIAHVETCTACQEEERAIRAVVAAAARLPRELAPDHDLWPGIAERIDRRIRFDFGWNLQWALGVTAVVLVAVAGLLVSGRGEKAVTATAVVSPRTEPYLRPASANGSASFTEAEAEFDRASAELLLFLERHREELPPHTVEEMKQHLTAIDTALDEIRAVLRENPGNAEATRLLASTQRRKIDALRRVVDLSRI